LVVHEMEWLTIGYRRKAEMWQSRADISHGQGKVGHQCYALQQKSTLLRFVKHAEVAFNKIASVQ
jgi:hypothetical protein